MRLPAAALAIHRNESSAVSATAPRSSAAPSQWVSAAKLATAEAMARTGTRAATVMRSHPGQPASPV